MSSNSLAWVWRGFFVLGVVVAALLLATLVRFGI